VAAEGGGRVFDAKFMAENCGRADLRGVGIRSVTANLDTAMPAEDLPWLAGNKSVTAHRIHTILRLHVLSQDTTMQELVGKAHTILRLHVLSQDTAMQELVGKAELCKSLLAKHASGRCFLYNFEHTYSSHDK